MTTSGVVERVEAIWTDPERLTTLASYGIVDTTAEINFDALAELAAAICDAPIALINFITSDRQWSKAEVGISVGSRPLYASICAHVLGETGITVVPDLAADVRFADDPTVVDEPHFRFYAGAPLATTSGLPLGMLCVLDSKPRLDGLSRHQQRALTNLAQQIMVLLELRRTIAEQQDERARFAAVCADAANRHASIEAALHKSEARLRSAIEVADIGEWTIDLETGAVDYGDQMSPIFGQAPGSVVVERVQDVLNLIHPDDRSWVDSETRRQIASNATYELEYRVVRSDGTVGWVATRGRLLHSGGKPTQLAGVTRDITAAREFNQELDRQVTRARAELERIWVSSEELLGEADYHGHLLRVSPSWTRTLGHSEADLLAGLYTEIIHPDDLPAVSSALTVMREQDKPVRYENRVRAADGRWLTIAWSLSPDKIGARLFAIGRDVTTERDLAQAVAQAQKIEMLGRLTGGVAHDFNNLLTPIVGGIDLLARKLPDDARAQRIASGALQSAERARILVQRLLAFGRRQTLQSCAIDIATLLDGIRELIDQSIGPRITLTVEVPSDLPPIEIDPSQLELAILNLCVNARDAMPDGGELRIIAGEPSDVDELPAGDYIGLAVTDTGSGMDAPVLAKATEPFFTTKAIGHGAGMGLSMVYGLVAQSGGMLNLKSQPGHGTTAELVLPIAKTDAAGFGIGPVTARKAEPAASMTVLLVDDEELIRMTVADTLRDTGYTIVEASSAAEALDHLGGGLEPDLLITDHLMPGMTGAVLAKQARDLLPGLPILMITGYANLTDDEKSGLVLLSKPFRHDQLEAQVSKLLAMNRTASVHYWDTDIR